MKKHSIFFPLVLISAGVLWILVNMGTIPADNLWALTRVWPVLLIGAGLGLIARSYWEPARLLIDVAVIAIAVLAIVFAAPLAWNTPAFGFGLLGGGVAGSGDVVTRAREVTGFDAISISYPAEVTILQGESEFVEIEAEDNLVDQLSSDVRSRTLVIENGERNWARRVNPTRPVRITISVKNLKQFDFSSAGKVNIRQLTTESLKITVSGAGELVIEQLKAESLECRMSGAGSATATGSADELVLNISGVGSFDGSALSSQQVETRISGAGSATVSAAETLDAHISGTGSINYYGSPTVTKSISGVGSINQSGK